MVVATLAFAVPIDIYFGVQMHDRGVLTFLNMVYLIGVSVTLGYLAALSMWHVWLKKKIWLTSSGAAQSEESRMPTLRRLWRLAALRKLNLVFWFDDLCGAGTNPTCRTMRAHSSAAPRMRNGQSDWDVRSGANCHRAGASVMLLARITETFISELRRSS
jgi:hypothetical protein